MQLCQVGIAFILGSTFLFGYGQLYGQGNPVPSIPYGDNEAAGNYAVLNGVRLYYEIYGKGKEATLLGIGF